jgi:hypothetical protein
LPLGFDVAPFFLGSAASPQLTIKIPLPSGESEAKPEGGEA